MTAERNKLEVTKLFLDIEYDTTYDEQEHYIWLITCCIRIGRKNKVHRFFAESGKTDEKEILQKFLRVVNRYQNFRIFTWSGASAEIPQLHKSCKRYDCMDLFQVICQNHTDLCQTCRREYPHRKKYSLKSVSKSLGFTPLSIVEDGRDALHKYVFDYLGSRNRKIKIELLRYGLDDVKRLMFIYDSLRRLHRQGNDEKKASITNAEIVYIRNFYEKHGSCLIRQRGVCGLNVELRFRSSREQLVQIQKMMKSLGVHGGISEDRHGFVLRYYGRYPVTRFMEQIKPRIKNDIGVMYC